MANKTKTEKAVEKEVPEEVKNPVEKQDAPDTDPSPLTVPTRPASRKTYE